VSQELKTIFLYASLKPGIMQQGVFAGICRISPRFRKFSQNLAVPNELQKLQDVAGCCSSRAHFGYLLMREFCQFYHLTLRVKFRSFRSHMNPVS